MWRAFRWLIIGMFVLAAGQAFLSHGDLGPAGPSPQVALASASGADLAARVGYNAGWRGPVLVQAVAYSGIESGWRVDAVSPTGCLGLWQLCPTRQRDLDPQTNADDAHGKWQACDGGSFSCAWDPYDGGSGNPAWGRDYAIAQQAVAGLPNGGAA